MQGWDGMGFVYMSGSHGIKQLSLMMSYKSIDERHRGWDSNPLGYLGDCIT